MARSPTSRTSVDGVRENKGRRTARRRRNTRRGSSDTGEQGNTGASDVDLTAARQLSEGNVTTASNVI